MAGRKKKRYTDGSDAAAIIGLNPYKTNIELWEEKTGIKEAPDISDKPYVIYGTKMEPILRESFQVKHPEYEIQHEENTIIRHPVYPFLFASLDGKLINKETGEFGILEIKTKKFHADRQKEDWKEGVPYNYYLQVLHYLNVTGAKFAKLFAELTYADDYQATKTYDFDIYDEHIKNDMEYLLKKEIEFWKYVEDNKMPPLILPEV